MPTEKTLAAFIFLSIYLIVSGLWAMITQKLSIRSGIGNDEEWTATHRHTLRGDWILYLGLVRILWGLLLCVFWVQKIYKIQPSLHDRLAALKMSDDLMTFTLLGIAALSLIIPYIMTRFFGDKTRLTY